MYSDLNDFLADLDKRKLLARIGDAVSPDLEIAAVTDRVCKTPNGGPGAALREAHRLRRSVASNVHGSNERMCLALGVKTLDDLAKEIDELMTPQMPEGIMDALKMLPMVGRLRDLMPKTVKDAPCQEIVNKNGTLDSLRLKCWPDDAASTSPSRWSSRKTPRPACATSARTACSDTAARPACTGSVTRGRAALPRRREMGKRLEAAVALSAEPVLPYCATAPMPEGLDELLLGGFLSRKRIEPRQVWTVDLEFRPARTSSSRDTSSRANGAAKGRLAITPASTRSPTIFRCSTSPASRSERGRPI
jgi:4-hydroxy-3-polyprenylbenzoate decarboxylase